MNTLTTTTQTGTLSDFIKDRNRPMNWEQAEAFAEEVNGVLIQLLHEPDNGFSTAAVCSYPKLPEINEISFMLIVLWALSLNGWLDSLMRADREKLERIEIIW